MVVKSHNNLPLSSNPNLIASFFLTPVHILHHLGDIGKAWNLAAESKNGASYYYTTIPVIYSPTYYARRLEWMRNREKSADSIICESFL